MLVAMAVVVVSCMGMIVRAMTMRAVMIVAGLAAGKAPRRAEDRDRPGDERAEQGQKDDELIHAPVSPA